MKTASTYARPLLTAASLLLTAAGALTLAASETVKHRPVAELARRAMDAEQAGRPDEAIRAYEELLRQDLSFESVASARLVELYTAAGRAPQALAWARKAAAGRPDPQAYLAGVYAGLGQLKEAEILLRQTISHTADTEKLTPLLWQLADVQERQGETAAALATLASACARSLHPGQKSTSRQRLVVLQERLKAEAAVKDKGAQPCEP